MKINYPDTSELHAIFESMEKTGVEKQTINCSACGYKTCRLKNGIRPKKTSTENIKKGDIVSIDVGACYEGFHGDNAWTFPCGEVSEEAKALMEATEKSLFVGIEQARAGNRLGDRKSTRLNSSHQD